MGWFSKKEMLPDLPELIEEGDELIGQQATASDGHQGVIDLVYRFKDGNKAVDVRDAKGFARCALNPDEYTTTSKKG